MNTKNIHAFNTNAAKKFGNIIPALLLGHFLWLEEKHSKVHVRLNTQCVLIKKSTLYSIYFYLKQKDVDNYLNYLLNNQYIKEIDKIDNDLSAYTINSIANDLYKETPVPFIKYS
jgi:hypothetical protein